MTGAPTTGHGPSDCPNTGIAKSALAALRAENERLREKVEILEAEIRIMRKIPAAIDAALRGNR